MISDFLETAKHNQDKLAFMKPKKNYRNLQEDMLKMVSFYEAKGLKEGALVLLFLLPSYEFYVAILAAFYLGINIVVPDALRPNKKVLANIKYVLVNNKTSLLATLNFKKPLLQVKKYQNYLPSQSPCTKNIDAPVLTTFTSGSTNLPKPILRSMRDLEHQVELIRANVTFTKQERVLSLLPIYTLLGLLNGNTILVAKKVKRSFNYQVDTILGPIKKLKLNYSLDQIKNVYFGGAILDLKEATKIKKSFPKAKITYAYGASEGVLIAKTNLDYYLENPFCFNEKIKGMEYEIINPNLEQVGEILIKGDYILGNNSHHTGDVGRLTNKGLAVLGRLKYSNLNANFYNYVWDQKLKQENQNVRLFTFFYQGHKYVFTSKKLVNKYDFKVIKVKKFYYDPKHKTKLNYPKMLNKYF